LCGFGAIAVPSPKTFSDASPLIGDPSCGRRAMPRLSALLILVCAACAGPLLPAPKVFIDPVGLRVAVRDIQVDLVRDCGIEQSLVRRDFNALQQWSGGNHWRIIITLNEVPAVEIWTREARFECGIASKAYGPRPAA
jgi:hypothetical protein